MKKAMKGHEKVIKGHQGPKSRVLKGAYRKVPKYFGQKN